MTSTDNVVAWLANTSVEAFLSPKQSPSSPSLRAAIRHHASLAFSRNAKVAAAAGNCSGGNCNYWDEVFPNREALARLAAAAEVAVWNDPRLRERVIQYEVPKFGVSAFSLDMALAGNTAS